MDVNELYPDRAERTGLLKRILQDGAVRNHETVLRRLDNTTVDVIMTMSLFTYEGEDTILSVIQDVTWKKQAEEETRHLKNYLANIIDSMPSILVGVDIEGLVTQWNTAAEETTGIGADLARGRRLEQVLPLLSHHIDLIRRAMRANRAETFPRLQSAIKGENRFLDVTVYPLVSNGVSGAVVRVDDVTERISMEEMMIQSEKMLSVGGLAAGMAHEINNPLGVIMAATQNVVRRIAPDLPANVKTAEACGLSLSAVHDYMEKRQILTFLEDIRNGVVRANQIVTNMLSFSRRPNEGGAPENMAELLDQTLLLAASDYDLKKKYDFRQIHIERDYHPNTPHVFCQASKIRQVFLNILRNGAEAMEENRSSEHPPCFKLRVLPDQDRLRIEISDNGPGMDESTRRRIFEPFFTTKPPGIGTGLGLSVSYFIVTQNHGGAISVKSSPGEGACFSIELPIKEGQA
ncbi:MAG TPA: ATP-binding protein [Syntrophales bacterium]|nr:ATP-binding protein [Syntrophales bacterium]